MTNFRWYKVAADISPFLFWTKLKLTGRITLIGGTTSYDIDQLATTTVPSSDKACSVQRLGGELTDRWPNFGLQACLKVQTLPAVKSPLRTICIQSNSSNKKQTTTTKSN